MGLSWRLGVLLVFLLVVGFLVAGSNPAGGTFETPLPGVLPSRWGFTFVRHGGCYAGTEFAGIRIFVRDGFGGSKTYRSELFFDALLDPPATRRADQTHHQVRAAGPPPPPAIFVSEAPSTSSRSGPIAPAGSPPSGRFRGSAESCRQRSRQRFYLRWLSTR